jgi:hypothetical protein
MFERARYALAILALQFMAVVALLLPISLIYGLVLLLTVLFPRMSLVALALTGIIFVPIAIYKLFTPMLGLLAYAFSWLLISLTRAPRTQSESEGLTLVRSELAQLYIDSQTEVNPSGQGLSVAISRSGLSEQHVREILETEVGPIMYSQVSLNAFAMEDAIDGPISSEWLAKKISERAPAYKIIRRMPVIGFFWARLVMQPVRASVESTLSEAYSSELTRD